MSIHGSATNHCLGNGPNHIHATECPIDHRISHSSEFRLTRLVTRLRADLKSTKTQRFNMVLLTELFGDWELSEVNNLHLFRLKEKFLRYPFIIQHCLGVMAIYVYIYIERERESNSNKGVLQMV